MPKKTFEAVEEVGGQLIVQIKENQRHLYKEVSAACAQIEPLSTFIAPVEKARNRIERRHVSVFNVHHRLIKSQSWNRHIACIAQVKRHTKILDTKTSTWKIREETSYYASSHKHSSKKFSSLIRTHWHIENKNHYVRDVVFKEDASRIRKNPGIVARLRSFTLNILRFNKMNNMKEALFENTLNFKKVLAFKGIF